MTTKKLRKDHYIGAFADAETADFLHRLAKDRHDGNCSLTLRILVKEAARREGLLNASGSQDDRECGDRILRAMPE